MENILEYLKRRKEEEKKVKRERIENYWKLKPIERIDYDNKLNKIKNENGIPFLSFTILILKFSFFLMIFFCVFNYFFGSSITESLIIAEKELVSCIFKIIPFILMVDIICYLFSIFNFKEEKSELNKRFKL